MKSRKLVFLTTVFATVVFISWISVKPKPVLYLIGDSTVAAGKGGNGLWGWGKYISAYFDNTKMDIENRAQGGTSSRTYLTKGVPFPGWLKTGLWDGVMVTLKPGDYVIMQFGHNDRGRIDDTTRFTGTLNGIGSDSVILDNKFLKRKEVVHTYGWYMRRFIADTKSRGAIPIICSPVPKNRWKDGKVHRDAEDYAKWASEIAAETNTFFIDLNAIIADEYDRKGETKVKTYFTQSDDTHTLVPGAQLNAASVVKGIRQLKKCRLKSYLK